MAATLNFSLNDRNVHSAFASIEAKLNIIQRERKIELNVANSLWPQDKYPFLKEYLKLNKKFYRTEITPVDYNKKPEAARKTIRINITLNVIFPEVLVKPGF